jgi:putative cell wall-binding protein
MRKKKQLILFLIFLHSYWIQNSVTLHRRLFENKLGYYAPITVDTLSSPDVGIVNDLISVDEAVALDLSEELNVTFRVAPSDVYSLTNTHRYNFNTSCTIMKFFFLFVNANEILYFKGPKIVLK